MLELSHLLKQMESQDVGTSEELLPLVYRELKRLAASKLARDKLGLSLQPTVLVHEAYLRLTADGMPRQWNGRGHFFAAASEAMRRILIENARRKLSQKKGGRFSRIEFENVALDLGYRERFDDLLAINEALERFESQWPDKAKLVKLRYFAGLTIPETAEVMKISVATAERYWTFSRSWLHAHLKKREE